jgi:prepilin-type N-terminal cleavage/methylation domain-containing protein
MNLIPNNPRRRGFTLVEMIGVLAVIAILAALLIPKVFSTINNARITSAASSVKTLSTAAVGYIGKYGKYAGVAGAAVVLPVAGWDGTVLLKEGFLDKPFDTQLGTATTVNLVAVGATGAVVGSAPGTYDLSGSNANELAGAAVVELVISNVSISDAEALNLLVDSTSLASAGAGLTDIKGKCKYAAPVGGVTDVRIYISHK